MSSTSQDGGLEDRLRGLILSNAQTTSEYDSESRDRAAHYLPPHLLGASIADQEAYMTKAREKGHLPKRPPQLPHGGRKRPNQAQRRQMNPQMPVSLSPGLGTQVQGQPYHVSFPPAGSASQHHPTVRRNAPESQFYQSPPNSRDLPLATSVEKPVGMQQQQWPAAIHYPQTQLPHHGTREMHQQGRPNNRGYHMSDKSRDPPVSRNRQLFQPSPYRSQGRAQPLGFSQEQLALQSGFLEALITSVIPEISMSNEESHEKESFRIVIEQICRNVIVNHEKSMLGGLSFSSNFIELKCFGSMVSGFATKMSDMDLALLASHVQPSLASSESQIPRLLEKKFLELGYGARLLTKTRVPIIKLCQKPTATLLLDLTEEREKWENNLHVAQEDEYDQESTDRTKKGPERVEAVSEEPAAEKSGKVSTDVYHNKISSFQQKPSQTLGDYSICARRLLQEVGGRDIVGAHSNALTDRETTILNDVCRAFVIGLSDTHLSKRLQASNSLSFPTAGPVKNQRSLAGVIMQVCGEQISMAWNSRPLQGSTKSSDVRYVSLIKTWGDLLNRTDMEVSAYDRALQQALTRLRKIPSLQLFFLLQSLHEDPVAYHARASAIMEDIKSEEKVENTNNDHIVEIVIEYYIAGVRPIKIREALQEMTTGTKKISLQNVLLEHRMLQLANDYECALGRKIYSTSDHADIKRYIDLLRKGSQIFISQILPAKSDTSDTIRLLIKKIRRLPDPTKGRDKYRDHLQFPKSAVGIQCDINFSAELGLQNTLLLRCYSLCDPRVKQIVLFVKHWAKVRCINTPYTGTLSSYGYVLMVLHYLVNVAYPFVLPNLQQCQRDPLPYLLPSEVAAQSICNGRDVRFWRNEEEIESLAGQGRINSNHDSLGKLLCEFYEYYAHAGPMSNGGRGFDWGRDVLSLRTQGGLLTKQEKGWTCAKTVIEKSTETSTAPLPDFTGNRGDTAVAAGASPTLVRKAYIREETKEIRHRYLFSLEDPFELDHNVARTVTHMGIVNIRDEFRRAWRIIKIIGKQGEQIEGGLLDPVIVSERESKKSSWEDIMELLHGQVGAPDSW